MKKAVLIIAFTGAALLGRPREASADITFFLGFNPKPDTHQVRGVAAGITMLILGFEFDYAIAREQVDKGIPGLQTGMFNILVQTPTSTAFYVTAGGGLYRESFVGASVWGFGTNLGGGVKIGLFGPIKVRVDYRIFALRGNARFLTPQRIYVGVNWAF